MSGAALLKKSGSREGDSQQEARESRLYLFPLPKSLGEKRDGSPLISQNLIEC
jgi:hypothetical protein